MVEPQHASGPSIDLQRDHVDAPRTLPWLQRPLTSSRYVVASSISRRCLARVTDSSALPSAVELRVRTSTNTSVAPCLCHDIDLATRAAPVHLDDVVALPSQIFGGDGFTACAGRLAAVGHAPTRLRSTPSFSISASITSPGTSQVGGV